MKARAFREGVRLILSVTERVEQSNPAKCVPIKSESSDLGNMSAKERLIRVLSEAGRPLKWSELQTRVTQGSNPPTPGTVASAYYHNTRSGDRCFVPLPDGYAGLAGRDENWEPDPDLSQMELESDGRRTLRGLVRDFIASHAEFTLKELQEAIHAERSDALPHTIRGHLSYAKTKGEVENIDRGRWRSRLCQEHRGEIEEDDTESAKVLEWLHKVATDQAQNAS